MKINSVVFALTSQIKKTSMRKQLISIAQIMKFLQHVKLKWGVNPNPFACALAQDSRQQRSGEASKLSHGRLEALLSSYR